MKKILLLFWALAAALSLIAQTSILPFGSTWKYLDDGSNQGTGWALNSFDDRAWKIGTAQLGYGDGDENTVVSQVTSTGNRYITTYFRKVINIVDVNQYSGFSVSLKRDDGAAVYVNGNKVYRTNLSETAIYNTLATLAEDDGNIAQDFSLPSSAFVNGNNVVAVEIHQNATNSTDISFDLQITGTLAVSTPPSTTTGCSGTGSIVWEYVNNVPWGTPLATLATAQASGSKTLTSFSSPQNFAEYYGSRTKGYICPPVTGNYVFYLAADDYAELNLSTDDNPANKRNIASVSNWTNPNTYNWYASQQSATISLTAGKKYYIEALHIEGNGGDHLSVAWKLPDGTMQAPIAGNSLVPYTGTVLQPPLPQPPTTLISFNSPWKYLDNGTDAGINWTKNGFSDGSWKTGNGQLGYGDGDETTIVSYGLDGNKKHVTTYFRKEISIADYTQYSSFSVSLKRDDGAVVYVNGIEVYRSNLPTGNIAYNTLAMLAEDDGLTPQTFVLPISAFTNGTNVIAVEMHQNAINSTDLSFDFELKGVLSTGTSPNPSTPGGCPGTGGVVWDYQYNVPWGTPLSAEVHMQPNGTRTLTSFAIPENFAEYYGSRLRAYICPPTSGDYTFYLSADDYAELWLSTDDSPGNEQRIASVGSWTTPNTYNWYPSQQSGVIHLDAGKKYYVEALHIEGNGGDHLSVAWKLPDGTMQAPISGNNLIPFTAIKDTLITRGPYLQMGNQTGVSLRWRSNVPTNSKIEVGTSLGNYTLSATKDSLATEHEVRINGLTPNTKYYYRFGSSSQTLQGDATQFFYTAPIPSETTKTRVAVFGDCGTSVNGIQEGTLNSYLNYVKDKPAELMVLLGDNAYSSGTDEEYQQNFFKAYGSTVLKNHMLYTTPGNHDYYSTDQTSRSGAYYKNFTLPTTGESGGVPSRTEAFYSFDWNNIHWLSLDSYGIEGGEYTRLYDTLGGQVNWIKRDLANNTKKWVIAFWHHPPYTMGSHNSDTEDELIKIRQNFIRILERLGVDLILCGHSHNYERSYLLNNYYGSELTFNPSVHTKSTSSAQYNGTVNSCPYFTISGQANKGTVYVVAGSSGLIQGVQSGYPHNALPFSMNEGGMLYLEVEGNRLDAKFLRSNNTIGDQFTIMKDVNKTSTVNLQAGTSTQLTASWIGSYRWSNGATTRSITVSPTSSTSYTVKDENNCLSDQFNVTVSGTKSLPAQARLSNTTTEEVKGSDLFVPTIIKRGQAINIRNAGDEIIQLTMTDNSGKRIAVQKFNGLSSVSTNSLSAGTYYLQIIARKKATTKKVIVVE